MSMPNPITPFVIEKLIKTGRTNFYFRSSAIVQRLIPPWIKLATQPIEYKNKFLIHNPEDEKPDHGLITHTKQTGKDLKTFFHFYPSFIKDLEEKGTDYDEYKGLFNECQRLYEQLETITIGLLQTFDLRYQGLNLMDRFRSYPRHRRLILRLLYYTPGQAEQLAVIHPDRALLAMHIAESRPGMRFIDQTEIFEAQRDTVEAFLGMKAEILSKETLKAVRHEAITTKENISTARGQLWLSSALKSMKAINTLSIELQRTSTNCATKLWQTYINSPKKDSCLTA